MAADLEFRIGAELTEIKGALASLRRDFASVGQSATRAGQTASFDGLERKLGSAAGAVGRLVAGFATLATAAKLIGAADEINTLNARLKIATSSTEEYNRAQVALFDLAQRTRSSLGETVNLYSRIALATKDAGVGQETLLSVVETVNQAVQLSGASAQAAEAALVQLGQGLASGTLRGEELNSILEQTPALADAIAKGMKITRGELREYGQQGKITAEQVIKALQAQKDVVANQFAQLPLTVGQSVTLLKNASLQLVGIFDSASGATGGLAQAIKGLADFLSSESTLSAMTEFASLWGDAFSQLVTDAQEAARIIEDVTQRITGGAGANLFDFLARAFRELPVNIRAAIRIATVEIAAFVDRTMVAFGGMADYIKAVFDPNKTVADVRAALLRSQSAIDQAREASIAAALDDRQRAIDDAKAKAETDAETRRLARRKPAAGAAYSLGTFKTKQSDAEKSAAQALTKARLDAEEKLQKDSSQRVLGILTDAYETSKIAAADYYAARERIELQALDDAIEIERRRMQGGTPADRAKALAEIELLERQKGDVKRKVLIEQDRAARDLERQLEQARAQEFENRGQTVEAARIRFEAQYRDLLQRLQAEGNTAGVALIRGLIDTGIAKARFDELRALADRFISDLERRRQDIENRVRLGTITPEQGRQEESAATADAIGKLAPVNSELQSLAQTLKDPALIAAANAVGDALRRMGEGARPPIEKLKDELRAALAEMEANLAKTATTAGVDALTNFFTDIASGSKSAGEALRDFVRGFVQSMAQIAARALATFLVLRMLDAVYPGLGQATAAMMGVSAGKNHSGGMAGTGPKSTYPAWLFAGAPRFHAGGMVGLKKDEVPAILQTGEEVLSRGDPRNAANGGGSGYRIVNVLDPSLVSGYLESSAGERSVLNVIGRNPAQVRQIIGA